MSDYPIVGQQARFLLGERPVFGGDVVLVQTLIGGLVMREEMPAALAAQEAMHGDRNGVSVMSSHVEFKNEIDRWGQSA